MDPNSRISTETLANTVYDLRQEAVVFCNIDESATDMVDAAVGNEKSPTAHEEFLYCPIRAIVHRFPKNGTAQFFWIGLSASAAWT